MDGNTVARCGSEGKGSASNRIICGRNFHQTISKDEDIIRTATCSDCNVSLRCSGCVLSETGVIRSNQGGLLSIQSGLLSSADRFVSVRGVVNITQTHVSSANCCLSTSISEVEIGAF